MSQLATRIQGGKIEALGSSVMGGLTANSVSALTLEADAVRAAVPLPVPPLPLTGLSSTLSAPYAQGAYTVTSSSNDVNAYAVFQKSSASSLSFTGYSVTTGAYTGAVTTQVAAPPVDGITFPAMPVKGAWVTLQVPEPIQVRTYAFRPTATLLRAPVTFVLAGSTDGVSWYTIDSRTVAAATSTNLREFTPESPAPLYTHFRLIIGKTGSTDGTTELAELVLYGIFSEPILGKTDDGSGVGVGLFASAQPPLKITYANLQTGKADVSVTGNMAVGNALAVTGAASVDSLAIANTTSGLSIPGLLTVSSALTDLRAPLTVSTNLTTGNLYTSRNASVGNLEVRTAFSVGGNIASGGWLSSVNTAFSNSTIGNLVVNTQANIVSLNCSSRLQSTGNLSVRTLWQEPLATATLSEVVANKMNVATDLYVAGNVFITGALTSGNQRFDGIEFTDVVAVGDVTGVHVIGQQGLYYNQGNVSVASKISDARSGNLILHIPSFSSSAGYDHSGHNNDMSKKEYSWSGWANSNSTSVVVTGSAVDPIPTSTALAVGNAAAWQLTQNVQPANNTLSCSLWVRFQNAVTESYLLSNEFDGDEANLYAPLAISSGGKLSFYKGGSGMATDASVSTLLPNVWYNIGFRAVGTTWQAFVNGKPEPASSAFYGPATHHVLGLGKYKLNQSSPPDGMLISDLRLWDRWISDEEVYHLYRDVAGQATTFNALTAESLAVTNVSLGNLTATGALTANTLSLGNTAVLNGLTVNTNAAVGNLTVTTAIRNVVSLEHVYYNGNVNVGSKTSDARSGNLILHIPAFEAALGVDVSGRNNNMTKTSLTFNAESNLQSYVITGNATNFIPTGSALALGNASTYQFAQSIQPANNTLSCSLWIKFQTAVGASYMLPNEFLNDHIVHYNPLAITADGQIGFFKGRDALGEPAHVTPAGGGTPLQPDVWYNIGFRASGSRWQAFINGKLDNAVDTFYGVALYPIKGLGRYKYNMTFPATGALIADLRFWDRYITDDEIYHLYRGVAGMPTSFNDMSLESLSVTTNVSTQNLTANALTVTGNTGSGNLAVVTNLTVGGSLAASGTITCAGDIIGYYTTASDIRLKSNLEVIREPLARLDRLTGYTFELKGRDPAQRFTGLIAQDVESVMPEAVTEHEGYKTVAYGSLMGVVIEAIKELHSRIRALEG